MRRVRFGASSRGQGAQQQGGKNYDSFHLADYTPTQGRYLSFLTAYSEAYGETPAESDIGTKGTPANCFGIDRLGLVSIGQGALRASRIGLEGSPYATRRPDGCCLCLDKLGAVRNAQAMIDISAFFIDW